MMDRPKLYKRLTLFFCVFLIIVSVLVLLGGLRLPPESIATATYIVSSDATGYHALDTTTNTVPYSGSDARTVIQSALNSHSGVTVHLRAGNYSINGTLLLDGYTTLEGENGAILTPTANDTIIAITAAYTGLHDLEIGIPAAYTGKAILVDGSIAWGQPADFNFHPAAVNNMYIHKADGAPVGGIGISIEGTTTLSHVYGVHFSNINIYGNFISGIDMNAAFDSSGLNANFFNNIIFYRTQYAVRQFTTAGGEVHTNGNVWDNIQCEGVYGTDGVFIISGKANQFTNIMIYDALQGQIIFNLTSTSTKTYVVGELNSGITTNVNNGVSNTIIDVGALS